MKNFSLAIIILLLAISSFLFWNSEKKMEQASEGYSIVYFENLDQEDSFLNAQDQQEILSFVIENRNKQQKEYQVEFSLDGQSLETIAIEILQNEKREIIPPNSTLENISASSKASIVYEILVKEDENDFQLNKKLNLK